MALAAPEAVLDLFSRLTLGNRRELLTALPDALAALDQRAKDPELRAHVEQYLKGDVPKHFSTGPILYLARHIATPNFETLRFLHLLEPSGLRTVIGQDIKDRFSSNNELKRALGKLPVSDGVTRTKNGYYERFSNVCVIDFNQANGKPLKDVSTTWGEPLHDFHARLFSTVCDAPVSVVDDSDWIDRNCRGDLIEHYKRFLSLFLVHGILVEDFETAGKKDRKQEERFKRTVLMPAFRYVTRRFGYSPLIVQLTPTSVESPRYWTSYPPKVLEAIPATRETRLDTNALS